MRNHIALGQIQRKCSIVKCAQEGIVEARECIECNSCPTSMILLSFKKWKHLRVDGVNWG